MPSTVLIKLGGSLITDKARVERYRAGVVQRVAVELASARGRTRWILGHGAGSFGHAAAARHGIGAGALPRSAAPGISETQDRTAALHRRVVTDLRRAGLAPYSIAPGSVAVATAGKITSFRIDAVRQAIEAGLLPVLHGDVVTDRRWRAAICSTENALLAVAGRWPAGLGPIREALWLGDTEGVYDAAGATIPKITPRTAPGLLDAVSGASATDVTGGMSHRVATALALARLGIPSRILDGRVPGRIATVLAGRAVPCTRVMPDVG